MQNSEQKPEQQPQPILQKASVSGCCNADMIPPDWDAAEEAGSMWRACACYLCKSCGKPCEPIDVPQ